MHTPGQAIGKPDSGWATTAHLVLILAVTAAAYHNALGNGFVTDDSGLLCANPNVKDWGRLWSIFTTGYWEAEGWTGGLYRPLTILTFLVEHTFDGLNPFYYHLDNVILHFMCSALAYLLLRNISEETGPPLFAALLFAAHPVHVEAVAWISGRAELLWALFGFSSILVFIRYPSRPLYTALSSALFALALLSKESAVVVPALLAAYMLIFGEREPGWRVVWRLAARLWPYLAVTAAYLAIKLVVIGRIGPSPEEQALAMTGPYDRFLIMSRSLYEYIRIGFIPIGLCNNYLFPPPSSFLDIRVLLAVASVAAAAAITPLLMRRSRFVLFALALFFIGLLPVSNIIPTGIIMSDRAMYMPVMGVCMLIGAALSNCGRIRISRALHTITVCSMLFLLMLSSFMAVTVGKNTMWHDAKSESSAIIERLNENIKLYPDFDLQYKILAGMLLRFRPFGPDTEKSVIDAYNRLGPDDPEIRKLMSCLYSNKGMPEAALPEILAAIDMVPDNASYREMAARILASMKRYDEALAMAGEAVRLNPNEGDYHILKGDLLMELGRDGEALREYETDTGLNPESHDGYLLQGIILNAQGRFGDAVERISRAVALRPDIPDLHFFLAVAYVDAGMPGSAKAELDEALRLRPDYREAIELRVQLGQEP